VFYCFHPTDGGASWSLVSSTRPTGSTPGALPFSGGKGGIAFASPTVGWVSVNVNIPGGSVLYQTSEAGATSKRQPVPAPAVSGGVVVEEVPVFFSATAGAAPVQIIVPPPHTGAEGAFLWAFDHTGDGGQSWSTQSAAPAEGVFDWLDAEYGWELSGPGLKSTTDGGRTWTKVQVDAPLSGIRQLEFVTLRVGWALGVTPAGNTGWFLLKTTDGGQAWERLDPRLI